MVHIPGGESSMPLTAGSRVGKVGLPINVQIQGFYNAARPELASDWQLRVQVQFLFPK